MALKQIALVWSGFVAVALLALVIVQFYAAGLFVFGAAGPGLHAALGYCIILTALVFTLLGFVADRRRVGLPGLLLFVLTLAQPVLAFVPRRSMPAISALHVVNALAIVTLVAMLARDLWPVAKRSPTFKRSFIDGEPSQ